MEKVRRTIAADPGSRCSAPTPWRAGVQHNRNVEGYLQRRQHRPWRNRGS
ncbi:hypothetical protein I545_1290 [Mycobacterium kansasii 662]|uniref:Uncharacterized protein n=1 Tax=Mycobacterium kansasii 662 TaxID=1299326 RepID=X7ZMQ9_MYCKA|nr:hypothetical protein I545_1290 [Mycobacterium kansasii 662]